MLLDDMLDLPSVFASKVAPTASFSDEIRPMPTAQSGSVQLPRPQNSRAYTGLGCWNSRGANLVRSMRAMLGDGFAYVETAEFTVRRLQLRHASDSGALYAARRRAIYKSSATRDWGGYGSFQHWHIDAAMEVSNLLQKVPAELKPTLEKLSTLARTSDDAAALLARLLMDVKFETASARRLTLQNLVKNRNYWKEQPEDYLVMWATVYPRVASKTYGPNTIVYEVDDEVRSADIPYLARLFERGYRLGQQREPTLRGIGGMVRRHHHATRCDHSSPWRCRHT